MLTFQKSQNQMQRLNRLDWYPDELSENIRQFNEMVQDIREKDQEAEEQKAKANATEATPPDQLREAAQRAKDLEYESIQLQLQAARFFRDNIQQQMRDAKHREAERRMAARNKLHQEKKRELINIGMENPIEADRIAADLKPLKDENSKVREVENLTLPGYGADEVISALENAVSEAAATL